MSEVNGAPVADDDLDEPAGTADRITKPPPWLPGGTARGDDGVSPPPSPRPREGRFFAKDPSSKMGRLRDVVQELGPGCTFEAARARLPELEVSASLYYKARAEVFPHLVRRQDRRPPEPPPAPPVLPLREFDRASAPPAPPAPPAARGPAELEEVGEIDLGPDWLSKLVKLACAVEAVGGVPTARRLLDAIETVRGKRL